MRLRLTVSTTKFSSLYFFAAFGMNNAMIPIIAFNYGKQDKKRVNDSIKYGLIYTVTILCAGIIILQIFCKTDTRNILAYRIDNRTCNACH